MREKRQKITKAPKARGRAPPMKRNPELAAQTRKILGRHYAAKYRVR